MELKAIQVLLMDNGEILFDGRSLGFIKNGQEKYIYDDPAKLTHFRDTTVGLWGTDKPEAIPDEKKDLFFHIQY